VFDTALSSSTTAGLTFAWGSATYIMGILNVTPDSFSGDGLGTDVDAAVCRAVAFQRAGAQIIDVGGESTRPGAVLVDATEELRRVLPAVRAIVAAVSRPVSVDTSKAGVADMALAAGARIVNDVQGLIGDAAMASVVRDHGATVVLMSPGRHRDVDVVARVRADLEESIERATQCGIPRERLILDPGFGFGKRWDENLTLLRRLFELKQYNLPLLVGLSRKSTIRRVLGSERQHRIPANATLVALAIAGGADIVRVHDVAEMAAAARLADAVIRGALPISGEAETA